MNDRKENKNRLKLFVVSLWDWHNNCDVAEEPFTKIIAANDLDEAVEIAKENFQRLDDATGEVRVDRENSFEVTEATGRKGTSYRVKLVSA